MVLGVFLWADYYLGLGLYGVQKLNLFQLGLQLKDYTSKALWRYLKNEWW